METDVWIGDWLEPGSLLQREARIKMSGRSLPALRASHLNHTCEATSAVVLEGSFSPFVIPWILKS